MKKEVKNKLQKKHNNEDIEQSFLLKKEQPQVKPNLSHLSSSHTIAGFQKTFGNMASIRFLGQNEMIQPKLRAGHSLTLDESKEHSSDTSEALESQKSSHLTSVQPRIQRSPADDGASQTEQTSPALDTPTTTTTQDSATQTTQTAIRPLIVEDSATDLEPGQMRKSEFLAQARRSVSYTTEAALAGSFWSAIGCPWIDQWFSFYSGQSARQIENAIKRYASGGAGITAAHSYIPIICSRIHQAIDRWKDTGEVSGIPQGISKERVLDDPTPPADIALKGHSTHQSTQADPVAVQDHLNSGVPLDSGIRSRMGAVMGRDFSEVRIHTDATASELSDDLNARAFTVGLNIAFGKGEYQPGSPMGDALIAHELAHVVQQKGGPGSPAPASKTSLQTDFLETQADLSAVNVVASMWGGIKQVTGQAFTQIRTGLGLQRCSKGDVKSKDTDTKDKAKKRSPDVSDSDKKDKTKKVTIPKPPEVAGLKPIGKYCSLYKVQKNEVYGTIFKKFSAYTDRKHFDMANRFKDKNKIREGDFLVIPHWSKWKDAEKQEMRKELEKLVEDAAAKHGIPVQLLKGLVDKEAGWDRKTSEELADSWDPCARSKTGPVGIMQMTKSTAKEQGLTIKLGYPTKTEDAMDERLDPSLAIDKGAQYLKSLYDKFSGAVDDTERWRCALGAYNQGFGAVSKGRKKFKEKNPDTSYTWLNIAEHMDKGPRGAAKKYVEHIYGKSGSEGGYAAKFKKIDDEKK